jgi:hypothetical protein
VASGAFRGTRDVVVALFTGGGRVRGSAENKSRGLGVKASRACCAAVFAGRRGGSGRQGGCGPGAFRFRAGVSERWGGSNELA